jgi:hypothetical protein
MLTPDQTARLKSDLNRAPTHNDVVLLTDQVIQTNASRKSHIFASRLQSLLGSVQQYCNIVDTCVGPNQIASLVWGSVKLVILVCTSPQCFLLQLTVFPHLGLVKLCGVLRQAIRANCSAQQLLSPILRIWKAFPNIATATTSTFWILCRRGQFLLQGASRDTRDR